MKQLIQNRMINNVCLPVNPVAKALNINDLSPDIPSTASSIDPSFPRNAILDPQIVVIVDSDTQVILAQMDRTAVM
jgi:hypothetical protein